MQNKRSAIMKSKYATLAVCVAAAGAFLLLNPHVQSQSGEPQSIKLEGAWIATVPGTPMLWTYTMNPDPSGRKASISGSVQVPVPPSLIVPGLFADVEYLSPMVGQIVLTGQDTANFTAVWYGLKKSVPFDQVVYIGVTSGQLKFSGPGKAEVSHNLSYYAPSKDTDGDGLPDAGQAADLCLPAISIDKQLPLLPPCSQ
jgi:hypothetical protein